MKMDKNIIIKIKKLLALSESSNEHEAKLAMLKAQELLAKNKLSMKEINGYKNINVTEERTDITFRKARWKGRLANIIAENFGCYNYYKTRYNHTIVFVGKDEDVMVCKIVLEYAIDTIDSIVKRLRYKYRKDGYSTKGLENDFALGFIDGLEYAFERQKEENQEWGLVLKKDKEVVSYYEDLKKTFTGTIYTNLNFKGFSDVYYAGVETGENFSISDKIVEDENSTLELEEAFSS